MAEEDEYHDLMAFADDRFIGWWDLLVSGEFKRHTLTIDKIYGPGHFRQQKDDKPIQKVVIGFKETDKKLVLCKTNKLAIALDVVRSKVCRDWKGQKITLCVGKAKNKGKMVYCVRVLAPDGSVKREKQPYEHWEDQTGQAS